MRKKAGKLLRTAINATTSSTASAAEDTALKKYILSISNKTTKTTETLTALSSIFSESTKSPGSNNPDPLSELAVQSLKCDRPNSSISSSGTREALSRQISSIICGDVDSAGSFDLEENGVEETLEQFLDIPWLPTIAQNALSFRRKEVSRERKQKWVFKNAQSNRFDRLVGMCNKRLGVDATLHVFGKLGRETGVKEFNALINLCIEKARNAKDEEISLEELHKAYRLFENMREQGFQIKEETYGPFLMFIIDMCMVEEFHFFGENIKKENPDSLSRLPYYEMLLWVRCGDKDKIQELINNMDTDDCDKSNLRENYLVALSEGDQEKEFLQLLDTIDIMKASSLDSMEKIFNSLGRFSLESYAKKFLMELKNNDNGAHDVSNLIYNYAISVPNLKVRDICVKFKNLHVELKTAPSNIPCEKLIKTCCESLKVHAALEIVEWMFYAGLTLTINTIHFILNACYESCEYNLVHHIYSLISCHKLKPNGETFRSMISLCVNMKDYDSAYGMIKDLRKMNLVPTANMYNTIMRGYFREKKFAKGLMVLEEMKAEDVKPDCITFSFIIGNCKHEDEIIKYHKELEESGAKPTKHIYMALINAYAACGLFEKAKQVVLDKGIPIMSLNEIKSVLVSALAMHGQVSDALSICEEMKKVEADLEPRAIIILIEHLGSEGQLSQLLLLLDQLHDLDYWHDGCCRIILYCVQHKHLNSAVDLLKQHMKKLNKVMAADAILDEVFCKIAETEPADVGFGLDLLKAVKEDIGLHPSRKSLDFLLSACANAKDLQSSFSVWKEYQDAGLPYNVLSFIRMYQALLASGGHKSAKEILQQIPEEEDDPHVRCLIQSCQLTYRKSSSAKSKKKKKKVLISEGTT